MKRLTLAVAIAAAALFAVPSLASATPPPSGDEGYTNPVVLEAPSTGKAAHIVQRFLRRNTDELGVDNARVRRLRILGCLVTPEESRADCAFLLTLQQRHVYTHPTHAAGVTPPRTQSPRPVIRRHACIGDVSVTRTASGFDVALEFVQCGRLRSLRQLFPVIDNLSDSPTPYQHDTP